MAKAKKNRKPKAENPIMKVEVPNPDCGRPMMAGRVCR